MKAEDIVPETPEVIALARRWRDGEDFSYESFERQALAESSVYHIRIKDGNVETTGGEVIPMRSAVLSHGLLTYLIGKHNREAENEGKELKLDEGESFGYYEHTTEYQQGEMPRIFGWRVFGIYGKYIVIGCHTIPLTEVREILPHLEEDAL